VDVDGARIDSKSNNGNNEMAARLHGHTLRLDGFNHNGINWHKLDEKMSWVSQGIYGFFARTRLLARPTLRDETSRETKVSHGRTRIVSAIPHLRQIFRHQTALLYCLRQYYPFFSTKATHLRSDRV
jgi:hypothetical protein